MRLQTPSSEELDGIIPLHDQSPRRNSMDPKGVNRLGVLVLAVLCLAGFAAQAQTSLVSTGAVWKYLDDGSDQGTAWRAAGFPDSTWLSGPAQLGYGDGDEATTNSFGSDANNKYITTYYRHSFNVVNAATYTNLLLRLLRDDGGVVYLNGTEVLRNNMPAGDILSTTLAVSAIEDAFVLGNPSPALLVNGANVLAVEIHQASTNSSDISFDLQLVGNYIPQPPTVVINSPTNSSTVIGGNVLIQATASDADGTVTNVAFFVDGSKVGEDSNSPYAFLATGLAPGIHTMRAEASDNLGMSASSPTVTITVQAPPAGTLIALGAEWKYLVTSNAADTAWFTAGFNDSGWSNGVAELGYGDGDEATVIGFGPDAANKYPTTYFRKKFNVSDPTLYTAVTMQLAYDDGALIYLNGQEIYRINMPPGPVAYNTFASGAADYGPDVSSVAVSHLITGENTMAVEMHQGNGGSSDLSFALQLIGQIPPRVAIVSPTNGQVVSAPVELDIIADASDPDGSVRQVEFYNGLTLLGQATNAPFSLHVSGLAEGNHTLYAIATDDSSLSVTSAPVEITVVDSNPPSLLSAQAISTNQVRVTFSKRLVNPSATASGNYSISPGINVLSAAYGSSSNIIVLTTSFIPSGADYTLTVNNVRDEAGNVIAPNSQIAFRVTGFLPADVGNPAIAGSATEVPGGYNVLGAGTNIFGAADQFFFNYREIDGDFDVKVRLDGLSATEAWAKAGLMARESLTAGSRHASAFATPSLTGAFFSYRYALNGATTNTGSFPAAYPSAWLRLKRVGATFTGYAGVDGQNWAQLGSVTLVAPASVFYVGMAVTGASATDPATAQFRNFGDAIGGSVGTVEVPFEPPGPSSRNTGLAITEIMYHPRHSNDLEFIELFNADITVENLGGCRISGDVDYTFPPNTVLVPGAYLVVARDPEALQAAYGISGVLGPWTGNGNATNNALPDDTGTIRFRNRANAVMLEVTYEGQKPWPIQADGTGHSLVLARPSYGEADSRAWAASDRIGGSPGRFDGYAVEPLRAVVVNEFLANTDPPLEDFIELYNHSNRSVDISGAYLSDDRDTNKFRIPNGTVLPARGFVSFSQSTLGFALSSGGERIYFVNPSQSRVLEAIVFEAQANGVSSGRFPNGAPAIQELASRTPGAANAPTLTRDVVINELMFHAISEREEDEYLELYNRSASPVNIGNWRFTDGIEFQFPANTIIPGNGYLVVARDQANLLAKYTQLNSTNLLGNYSGNLANAGERIALSMPDYFLVTNNNVVSTQANYVVVDEVAYVDHGRWTRWADGGGSSLELIDPNSDNNIVANWADSDETRKGAWTNVYHKELTDHVYPRGSPGADMNEVQVMILGAGEVLLDDLEVRSESPAVGPNLLVNGTFNSGLGGWTIQGNHIQSRLEPDSEDNPTQCLRIRASAGGDNGVNRLESDLSGTIAVNTQASIRGKLRWLKGHPDVLIRLHGGGLEALVSLPLPPNLGTPGQPNSRRVSNAGPAVYDVKHSPVLPAADEPVRITARISDPDGIGSAEVQYRLDPAVTLSSVAMVDNGTGGDAVANDGLYTATLPGQSAGTLVAFRIQARDDRTPAPGATLFPEDAPARECLIRFGDPGYAGSLGVYRLWMTAANMSEWQAREVLSNEALDGTFVYNNYRVIYNASARYRGSPFIRPGYGGAPNSGAKAYVWNMPDDDMLLGQDELNLDSLEPQGRDSTALREITAFTLVEQMDWPSSYQRFVRLVMNGVGNESRNVPIFSDSQQPNSSYITSWFPDEDDGEIFKIDDWFEFTDNPVRMQANKSASLQNFTTTGGAKKKARYRWSWEKKFNRRLNDDYSSLFVAVDALNAPDASYVHLVEDVFDIEQWLGSIAMRHVVGDWDGYGYSRGKNNFSYRKPNGKWYMLQWDLDFALGCSGGHAPEQDLFSVALGGDTGSDHMPEAARLYNHPHFRRIYLRNLLRIADGPLQVANYMPIMDARYRTLQANGVSSVSPYVASGAQGISIPAWLDRRRAYIYGANGVGPFTNATFRITSPLDITTNGNVINITGMAPLLVKDILINGVAWPVTWTTVTGFTARILVDSPSNRLAIAGQDTAGNIITSTQTVNITFTGTAVDPREGIVINEIMYNPALSETSFIELYNRSASTFDLSRWRLNGAGLTFPAGTFMTPGQFLLVGKNRAAFGNAYRNPNIFLYAEFDGQLDNGGETLTLLKPGAGQETIIDRVRYDDDPPWPAVADGGGASLQLIDANQDNSRVSNWGAGATWRQLTRTGNIGTGTNLLIWLPTAGDVYIDDVSLVLTSGGTNILLNGDFESDLAGTWIVPTNMTPSEVTTTISRSGARSLHLVSTSPGGQFSSVLQNRFLGRVTPNATYTLTLWWYAGGGIYNLNMRTLPGNNLSTNVLTEVTLATPGTPNTLAASIPAYQPLWLNEVQPVNQIGVVDNAGDRDPWIELYNAGTNAISLEGYYLSSTYGNLIEWAFPAGSSIGPGEFKLIWTDGETSESTAEALHTSFGITGSTGSVALARSSPGRPEIMDYLNYRGQQLARSYGEFPDGQPFDQQIFFIPTPGASNQAHGVTVFINEWLADNVSTLADPVDGQFEDWFELHNPGLLDLDLSGYRLTDTTNNRTQFTIPNNTVIPAGGFLLVWADGEAGQNNNSTDLHTNFRLGAGGELIALYTPDGDLVDLITFGPQTADISEGRFPDSGPRPFYAMSTPTPRAPNILDDGGGNRPPVIDPIGDKHIILGQTLTFPVTASDPNAGQSLTYSLTQAPSGAGIGGASGVFSWKPTTAQTPSVNDVIVQVLDNGTPPLAATRSFTIYVSPPPQVRIHSTPDGSGISLAFPSIAGKRYQVLYKNDLSNPAWTPLGDPETATGNSIQINDVIGALPHRFYQVQVLD